MKRPHLPLRAQYAVITCGLVALAVVMLICAYLGFYALYDRSARKSLPASVEAELEALESGASHDYARWNAIYEDYQLEPSTPLQTTALIGIGVAVLALTAIIGFVLAERFGRPVAAVALAAQQVARGDLSARAHAPRPANVELSSLIADFNAMADHLERAEKERRMSSAAIAHELRTPLTVMRGRLQGMLDGVFGTNQTEVMLLLAQTELLARIVEDLRTVTLAEAGRLELRWNTVELHALAAECIELMRPRLAHAGLRAELVGPPVSVRADRDRLMQALTAFLDNASRYAAHSEVVEVRVGCDDDAAFITVADRGPGLPPGAVEHAFQGFWRAEESRSRSLGGSGLGLAIVQAIAFAHGAKASARTREGGGAVFEIRLPLPGAEPAPRPARGAQ